MKKKAFLMNAVLLTASSLLARTIGISFRVYVAGKIGAEGMGLYQLITTVYFFLVTFATSGISLAVTRLVTEVLAEHDPARVKSVNRRCFYLGMALSLTAGAVLFFGAETLGTRLLGDRRTILSLKILAPSLPFMAVSACFRGYFYAVRKVIKTASEQLFEQLVEIMIFAAVVGMLAPKGVEYACCAIVLGTTGAEVLSCVYSYLLYWLDIRRLTRKREKQPGLTRKILGISLPVTFSSCMRSGLSMVENILIPSGLRKYGATGEGALSGYGMLTGMVMPVLTFPSAFLTSFSMLLIPELSEANAKHHRRNIHYIAGRVFQITLLFAVLVTGVFLFFAKDLTALIYADEKPGAYLCLLAPVIPLMYLDSVVDGMLKGLNEQLHSMAYNMIDSTLRVVLIFFLVPQYGLAGFIAVVFFSEIFNSTLSIARLMKVTSLRFKVMDWIIKPALAVALPGLLLSLFARRYGAWFSSPLMLVLFEILLTLVCYAALLFALGCVGSEEVQWAKKVFMRGRTCDSAAG
jgi:stage V sporulation protein B